MGGCHRCGDRGEGGAEVVRTAFVYPCICKKKMSKTRTLAIRHEQSAT